MGLANSLLQGGHWSTSHEARLRSQTRLCVIGIRPGKAHSANCPQREYTWKQHLIQLILRLKMLFAKIFACPLPSDTPQRSRRLSAGPSPWLYDCLLPSFFHRSSSPALAVRSKAQGSAVQAITVNGTISCSLRQSLRLF